MALTSQRILCSTLTRTPCAQQQPLLRHRSFLFPSRPPHREMPCLLVVSASKKLSSSSRTGRFDSKNRRSSVSTKDDEEEEVEEMGRSGGVLEDDDGGGLVMPELQLQVPGDKPDFWEGSQWDAFGFFLQYLWAFGIVFALIACGIAVATYNEGATDFKDTPAYKESIQSRQLLEEPEDDAVSNPEVFESNPTEQAPSLD